MLVRHLCFNQNSYLKTENLLFLHIRSSRSRSKSQNKISMLIFKKQGFCDLLSVIREFLEAFVIAYIII